MFLADDGFTLVAAGKGTKVYDKNSGKLAFLANDPPKSNVRETSGSEKYESNSTSWKRNKSLSALPEPLSTESQILKPSLNTSGGNVPYQNVCHSRPKQRSNSASLSDKRQQGKIKEENFRPEKAVTIRTVTKIKLTPSLVSKPSTIVRPEDVRRQSSAKPSSIVIPEDVRRQSSAKPSIIVRPEDVRRQSSAKLSIIVRPEDVRRQPSAKPSTIVRPEDVRRQSSPKPSTIVRPEDVRRQSSPKPSTIVRPEDVRRQSSPKPSTIVRPEDVRRRSSSSSDEDVPLQKNVDRGRPRERRPKRTNLSGEMSNKDKEVENVNVIKSNSKKVPNAYYDSDLELPMSAEDINDHRVFTIFDGVTGDLLRIVDTRKPESENDKKVEQSPANPKKTTETCEKTNEIISAESDAHKEKYSIDGTFGENKLTAARTVKRKVRNKLTAARTVKRKVRNKLTAATTVKRKVRNKLTAARTVKRKVRNKLTAATTVKRKVRNKLTAPTTVKRKVRNKLTSARTVKRKVRNKLTAARTVKRKVRKQPLPRKCLKSKTLSKEVAPNHESVVQKFPASPKQATETSARINEIIPAESDAYKEEYSIDGTFGENKTTTAVNQKKVRKHQSPRCKSLKSKTLSTGVAPNHESDVRSSISSDDQQKKQNFVSSHPDKPPEVQSGTKVFTIDNSSTDGFQKCKTINRRKKQFSTECAPSEEKSHKNVNGLLTLSEIGNEIDDKDCNLNTQSSALDLPNVKENKPRSYLVCRSCAIWKESSSKLCVKPLKSIKKKPQVKNFFKSKARSPGIKSIYRGLKPKSERMKNGKVLTYYFGLPKIELPGEKLHYFPVLVDNVSINEKSQVPGIPRIGHTESHKKKITITVHKHRVTIDDLEQKISQLQDKRKKDDSLLDGNKNHDTTGPDELQQTGIAIQNLHGILVYQYMRKRNKSDQIKKEIPQTQDSCIGTQENNDVSLLQDFVNNCNPSDHIKQENVQSQDTDVKTQKNEYSEVIQTKEPNDTDACGKSLISLETSSQQVQENIHENYYVIESNEVNDIDAHGKSLISVETTVSSQQDQENENDDDGVFDTEKANETVTCGKSLNSLEITTSTQQIEEDTEEVARWLLSIGQRVQSERCSELKTTGLMSPQPAASDKSNDESAIERELFISNINKSIESSDNSPYEPSDHSKRSKSCGSPQKNNLLNVQSLLEKIPMSLDDASSAGEFKNLGETSDRNETPISPSPLISVTENHDIVRNDSLTQNIEKPQEFTENNTILVEDVPPSEGFKKNEDTVDRIINPPSSLEVSPTIKNQEMSNYSSKCNIPKGMQPTTKPCKQIKPKKCPASRGKPSKDKMPKELLENIPKPLENIPPCGKFKKNEDTVHGIISPPSSLEVLSTIENQEKMSNYSSNCNISEGMQPITKPRKQTKQKKRSASCGRPPKNKMPKMLLENIPVTIKDIPPTEELKKNEDTLDRITSPPCLQVSSTIENHENLSNYSSTSKISERTEPRTKPCKQIKQKKRSASHGRPPKNKMPNDLLENIPVPMKDVLLPGEFSNFQNTDHRNKSLFSPLHEHSSIGNCQNVPNSSNSNISSGSKSIMDNRLYEEMKQEKRSASRKHKIISSYETYQVPVKFDDDIDYENIEEKKSLDSNNIKSIESSDISPCEPFPIKRRFMCGYEHSVYDAKVLLEKIPISLEDAFPSEEHENFDNGTDINTELCSPLPGPSGIEIGDNIRSLAGVTSDNLSFQKKKRKRSVSRGRTPKKRSPKKLQDIIKVSMENSHLGELTETIPKATKDYNKSYDQINKRKRSRSHDRPKKLDASCENVLKEKMLISMENSHLGELNETILKGTEDYKQTSEQMNERKRSRSRGRPKKHDTSNEKDLQENIDKSKENSHLVELNESIPKGTEDSKKTSEQIIERKRSRSRGRPKKHDTSNEKDIQENIDKSKENSHLGELTETISTGTQDYKKISEQINERKRSRSRGRPKKHDTSNEKDLQENIDKSKENSHLGELNESIPKGTEDSKKTSEQVIERKRSRSRGRPKKHDTSNEKDIRENIDKSKENSHLGELNETILKGTEQYKKTSELVNERKRSRSRGRPEKHDTSNEKDIQENIDKSKENSHLVEITETIPKGSEDYKQSEQINERKRSRSRGRPKKHDTSNEKDLQENIDKSKENSHLGELNETILKGTEDYKQTSEQMNERKRSRSRGRPKKHDTSNEKDLQENIDKSKENSHLGELIETIPKVTKDYKKTPKQVSERKRSRSRGRPKKHNASNQKVPEENIKKSEENSHLEELTETILKGTEDYKKTCEQGNERKRSRSRGRPKKHDTSSEKDLQESIKKSMEYYSTTYGTSSIENREEKNDSLTFTTSGGISEPSFQQMEQKESSVSCDTSQEKIVNMANTSVSMNDCSTSYGPSHRENHLGRNDSVAFATSGGISEPSSQQMEQKESSVSCDTSHGKISNTENTSVSMEDGSIKETDKTSETSDEQINTFTFEVVSSILIDCDTMKEIETSDNPEGKTSRNKKTSVDKKVKKSGAPRGRPPKCKVPKTHKKSQHSKSKNNSSSKKKQKNKKAAEKKTKSSKHSDFSKPGPSGIQSHKGKSATDKLLKENAFPKSTDNSSSKKKQKNKKAAEKQTKSSKPSDLSKPGPSGTQSHKGLTHNRLKENGFRKSADNSSSVKKQKNKKAAEKQTKSDKPSDFSKPGPSGILSHKGFSLWMAAIDNLLKEDSAEESILPEQLENTKDGINPSSRPMSPDSDSGISGIQIKNVCSVREVKSEPVSPVKHFEESNIINCDNIVIKEELDYPQHYLSDLEKQCEHPPEQPPVELPQPIPLIKIDPDENSDQFSYQIPKPFLLPVIKKDPNPSPEQIPDHNKNICDQPQPVLFPFLNLDIKRDPDEDPELPDHSPYHSPLWSPPSSPEYSSLPKKNCLKAGLFSDTFKQDPPSENESGNAQRKEYDPNTSKQDFFPLPCYLKEYVMERQQDFKLPFTIAHTYRDRQYPEPVIKEEGSENGECSYAIPPLCSFPSSSKSPPVVVPRISPPKCSVKVIEDHDGGTSLFNIKTGEFLGKCPSAEKLKASIKELKKNDSECDKSPSTENLEKSTDVS